MPALRPGLLALALLGAGGAAAAATPPAEPAPVREEFLAALAAASRGESADDSAALRRYVLYPYVQAARLRHALSRVAGDARDAALERSLRAFLAEHGDAPVTRDLLREWLAFLGERRAWAEFQAAAPAELADLSLRCHALSARLAQDPQANVREAALALWLDSREAPPACEPVFAWLDVPERLSDAEIEQRARFAAQVRAKPPASLAVLLPPRRALMQLWDRLMAAPERELKRYLAGQDREGLPPAPDRDTGEALLEAFARLARADSRRAAAIHEQLQSQPVFDDEQRGRLLRAHALGLAYDFDEAAVAAFAAVPAPALDALSHEWRVRAALRHGQWSRARDWLAAMPEPQRQEPRWRYWHARALEQLGQGKEARTVYEAVAREREYYGFLAAERLGRKPDLRPLPLPDDVKEQRRLAALPPMQRARELVECALPDLAAAELRYALRAEPSAARAQAARLVTTWGWFQPAVLLLSELQQWDDLPLRFPLPYEAEIAAAAKDTGLPAEWLYAVLRTESLYDPRAVSSAGALGLLQLRLATARQVAKRAGLPQPQRDDLFVPAVNIALGARYLREMQTRFGERFILTLAAYNAGPRRVPGWLPPQALPADVWIETIPYNETRTYVQRALSTLVIVGWRRGGVPAPLEPLLADVPPAKGQ